VSYRDEFAAASDELTGNHERHNDSVVRTGRAMAEYDFKG
jgi:hypothetical protein